VDRRQLRAPQHAGKADQKGPKGIALYWTAGGRRLKFLLDHATYRSDRCGRSTATDARDADGYSRSRRGCPSNRLPNSRYSPSTVADNVSRWRAPLSVNPSRKWRCLRARAPMMASAYSYRPCRDRAPWRGRRRRRDWWRAEQRPRTSGTSAPGADCRAVSRPGVVGFRAGAVGAGGAVRGRHGVEPALHVDRGVGVIRRAGRRPAHARVAGGLGRVVRAGGHGMRRRRGRWVSRWASSRSVAGVAAAPMIGCASRRRTPCNGRPLGPAAGSAALLRAQCRSAFATSVERLALQWRLTRRADARMERAGTAAQAPPTAARIRASTVRRSDLSEKSKLAANITWRGPWSANPSRKSLCLRARVATMASG
jgi:hypothetical protein